MLSKLGRDDKTNATEGAIPLIHTALQSAKDLNSAPLNEASPELEEGSDG